ncbi:hypothetical protein [uncultured Maritimibacter sp.]|jgi:hypothetical protein|uniref:hypothetical protein n=1 Tax=uncultured Maritimibacter sp. TaxID=991866 RepID=UPI00261F84EC|nr:hypothetical protein [uncultured Maritimibacter sp.]
MNGARLAVWRDRLELVARVAGHVSVASVCVLAVVGVTWCALELSGGSAGVRCRGVPVAGDYVLTCRAWAAGGRSVTGAVLVDLSREN